VKLTFLVNKTSLGRDGDIADITSLERQRGFLHRLQELRKEIRALTEERGNLQAQIEANVEKQNSDQDSLFSAIEYSLTK
jgi:chromosome segregation ATPase